MSETRRLARDVGRLLLAERSRQNLTQTTLAYRSGITQQLLSRLERGRHAPTLDVVERAFAALGAQLVLDLEPLDSELDVNIARQRALTDEERLRVVAAFDFELRRLRSVDLDYRIDGSLAAFLQGVPIRVSSLDLAIAPSGAPAFKAWLGRIPNVLRWSARHRDFRGNDRDPLGDGPPRWGTPVGEIRARVVDRLPAPVVVRLGAEDFAVMPLADVIANDRDVARVAGRL